MMRDGTARRDSRGESEPKISAPPGTGGYWRAGRVGEAEAASENRGSCDLLGAGIHVWGRECLCVRLDAKSLFFLANPIEVAKGAWCNYGKDPTHHTNKRGRYPWTRHRLSY